MHRLKKLADFKDRHHFVYALIGAAAIFAGLFIISFSRLDPDFGWHLTTGKYILSHGIPRHDFYTYTAKNHLWVDHEWGNDLILALIYNLGGYLLAAIFFALIWTAGLLIIGWGSRIWVLITAALAISPYAGIRPIAWSVLLFALTLRILWSKNPRWQWYLPVFFIPWANLHAGFIAGLALIAYFALKKRDLKLLAIFTLSALATLINAYGVNLYVEVTRTLFDPALHNQINEWRPFYIVSPTRPYVLLWIIGFIWFAKPFWRRFISIGPLLLAAGLSASRNFPFFITAVVGNVDQYVSLAKKQLSKAPLLLQRALNSFAALVVVLVLIYGVFLVLLPIPNRNGGYPVQAVAYLKKQPCKGHLFNDYNYGGYLIWQLPGVPDYIDGRMVTWQSNMDTYLRVINSPSKNYQAQFTKYDIKCVLVSQTKTKLIKQLKTNHWQVILSADQSILLRKD